MWAHSKMSWDGLLSRFWIGCGRARASGSPCVFRFDCQLSHMHVAFWLEERFNSVAFPLQVRTFTQREHGLASNNPLRTMMSDDETGSPSPTDFEPGKQ